MAVWTGSVTRADDGTWRLYYTGLSTAGHGVRDQRLGLAVSDDLFAWRRAGGGRPLLEADPRWYRTLDGHGARERDVARPFVFRDRGGDGWHMLMDARDARRAAASRRRDRPRAQRDGLRWTLGRRWAAERLGQIEGRRRGW